ncbi:MAG: hypothetical protein QM831_44550 [Kofleriaceae bacterium]
MAAVLVHIDLDARQHPDPSSLLALAAGRHVASSWGATLYAAILIHDPDAPEKVDLGEVETLLSRAGADKIVVAFTTAEVGPMWSSVGNAWQCVLDELRPRLVLFGADAASAIELGPRTASRLGARLLLRSRVRGIDDVEIVDRDGGYARLGDGGAAVALIGRASIDPPVIDRGDVDVLVLNLTGAHDDRIELIETVAAPAIDELGVVIVVGDNVDDGAVANAKRLGELLHARVIEKPERSTPLAPELVITIGATNVDIAGTASIVKIGVDRAPSVDGHLAALADVGALVKKLERPQ